jgi:ribosomal-protein-alanine N-acetyltransferase
MLPLIRTSRLVLHPIAGEDRDRLWRLLTEPAVRRYLCDDVRLTRAQVAGMLAESLKLAQDGLGLWMVAESSGDWLGCVGLQPVPATRPELQGEVEPIIAILPQFQHRGYATEALTAACNHAFEELGRERVVALVDEPNLASHRLLRRVGFVPAGTCAGPRHLLQVYALEARACPDRRPGAGLGHDPA